MQFVLFVLVSLAPVHSTWPTKFWWGNKAHLLKLWTLVQRCVALMNEGAELQVVNDLFAFDMVRNKSLSLFGALNLDHFTWGLGRAVSIECHLLIFRAVSGFRHWSAAVAFKQMLTCQYAQGAKIFGVGRLPKLFISVQPRDSGCYKQHTAHCFIHLWLPRELCCILRATWWQEIYCPVVFLPAVDLWLKVRYIMAHLPMLTTFHKIMALLNGWMPLSTHFPSELCR